MAESPPWLKEAEDCAVRLVREAGGLLMERFQRPMAIEYKDKEGWRDPVTEADRTAETFLSNELAARFPTTASWGRRARAGLRARAA